MPVRVGINGFGRIGRNVFRAGQAAKADIEWVAVNDITDNATLAHLLRYDTAYGRYPGTVESNDDGLVVDGNAGQGLRRARPGQPAVGRPRRRRRPRVHRLLHRAATTRPSTWRRGRRRSSSRRRPRARTSPSCSASTSTSTTSREHDVISNASCTTNCLAPFAKVAHETVGIKHGLMTTIHAYTGDQRLQDAPHSDLRRARAAAMNLVPTSTGAAKAVGLVLPELNGKLHGFSIRAPVITGSVVDLTFEAARETSVDELNAAFKAAAEGDLKGILRYNEDPIVSTDIIGDEHSSIVDAPLTAVIDGTLVKVVSWYDNEWGYSNRCVDVLQKVL